METVYQDGSWVGSTPRLQFVPGMHPLSYYVHIPYQEVVSLTSGTLVSIMIVTFMTDNLGQNIADVCLLTYHALVQKTRGCYSDIQGHA